MPAAQRCMQIRKTIKKKTTYTAQTSGGPLQALRKEPLPCQHGYQHGKGAVRPGRKQKKQPRRKRKKEDLEAGTVDQGEKGDGEPGLESRRRAAALGGSKGDEEQAGGDETEGGDKQGASLGKDWLHGDHGGSPEEERGQQHHPLPPRARAPLDIGRRDHDHALHIRPRAHTFHRARFRFGFGFGFGFGHVTAAGAAEGGSPPILHRRGGRVRSRKQQTSWTCHSGSGKAGAEAVPGDESRIGL